MAKSVENLLQSTCIKTYTHVDKGFVGMLP